MKDNLNNKEIGKDLNEIPFLKINSESKNRLILHIVVYSLLCVTIIFLTIENRILARETFSNTLVLKDNLLYKAVSQDNITEEKVYGAIIVGVSNLLNHNQYNYEQRTEDAKAYFSEMAYDYLLNRLNAKGNILDYYRKYDASLETTFTKPPHYDNATQTVMLELKQRFVFADAEPIEKILNFRVKVRKAARSDKNLFGVVIDEMNMVQSNDKGEIQEIQ